MSPLGWNPLPGYLGTGLASGTNPNFVGDSTYKYINGTHFTFEVPVVPDRVPSAEHMLKITWHGISYSSASSSTQSFGVFLDGSAADASGTKIGTSTTRSDVLNGHVNHSGMVLTQLSSGSHTLSLQALASAGTGVIYNNSFGTPCRLLVESIGPVPA